MLRAIVANRITGNQAHYPQALLGKEPTEYATWIRQSTSWGGAIELAIFAEHFSIEFAAVDISTSSTYVFGESRGFLRRGYLLYSGIHYDALAVGEEERLFLPSNSDALAEAIAIAQTYRESGNYTDTQSFCLSCDSCGKQVAGQAHAQLHAKQFGHVSFSEVRNHAR